SLFRPRAMLQMLEDEEVEYVVIGGIAAGLGGASHVTFDLDITPLRERSNLDRLARALVRLNARLREVPDQVADAFQLDGAALDSESTRTSSARSGPRWG